MRRSLFSILKDKKELRNDINDLKERVTWIEIMPNYYYD